MRDVIIFCGNDVAVITRNTFYGTCICPMLLRSIQAAHGTLARVITPHAEFVFRTLKGACALISEYNACVTTLHRFSEKSCHFYLQYNFNNLATVCVGLFPEFRGGGDGSATLNSLRPWLWLVAYNTYHVIMTMSCYNNFSCSSHCRSFAVYGGSSNK